MTVEPFASPYSYPNPSFYPTVPSGVHTAQPEVTVSPCPSWAPTFVDHGGWFECKAYIPPDPGGPIIAPCDPALASPYPCPSPTPKS